LANECRSVLETEFKKMRIVEGVTQTAADAVMSRQTDGGLRILFVCTVFPHFSPRSAAWSFAEAIVKSRLS